MHRPPFHSTFSAFFIVFLRNSCALSRSRLFVRPALWILLRVRKFVRCFICAAAIERTSDRSRNGELILSVRSRGMNDVVTSWMGGMGAWEVEGMRWRDREEVDKAEDLTAEVRSRGRMLFFVQAPTDTDRLIERLTGESWLINQPVERTTDTDLTDWDWHGTATPIESTRSQRHRPPAGTQTNTRTC